MHPYFIPPTITGKACKWWDLKVGISLILQNWRQLFNTTDAALLLALSLLAFMHTYLPFIPHIYKARALAHFLHCSYSRNSSRHITHLSLSMFPLLFSLLFAFSLLLLYLSLPYRMLNKKPHSRELCLRSFSINSDPSLRKRWRSTFCRCVLCCAQVVVCVLCTCDVSVQCVQERIGGSTCMSSYVSLFV